MTSPADPIAMQPLRSSSRWPHDSGEADGQLRAGASAASPDRRSDVLPQAKSARLTWKDAIAGVLASIANIGHPVNRQSIAFFFFGLLNNSLYVVILTAALELIPKGTPTGLVAFFNIFPALVAKAVWPYVLRGTVRYTRRLWSCVAMSAVGLLIIALLPSLWTRLAGIALASFSSGLGELTFLQLSTRFSRTGAGRGVGWFSSGTGAAGLVGASAWWIVRPLGVRDGLLSLGFLPVLMGLTYAFILPTVQAVDGAEVEAKGAYEPLHAEAYDIADDDTDEEGEGGAARPNGGEAHPSNEEDTVPAGVPLSVSPHASSVDDHLDDALDGDGSRVRLSLADKMELIKPMLFVYIVPLVLVYFFEYTINQGVAPTLLYPLPTHDNHPLLSLIIKELKDYYPFYQLTYQTFVFLSRSSVSIFRLPAIPKRYLWVPAILQGLLLAVLTTESIYNWFRTSIASPLAIVLVCVEGLAGGSA